MTNSRKIAVVGLGYVGLPVAVSFANAGRDVVGFDVNPQRIEELARGFDRTREVEEADLERLVLAGDTAGIANADVFIVTVPTPILDDNQPDLGPLRAATKTISKVLRPGGIVVYESTVYPGVTEEVCVPILEAGSGLVFGESFSVGYSPERINPGDRQHRFETITKVVAGSDPETTTILTELYGSVVKAGIHIAPSIKAAEAAKVIENTQRDINIALMNELAKICHKLNVDTGDVLAAAGTKWNFLNFSPGLVGGHCIGVDPYYLTFRAQSLGVDPHVILSGRNVNDSMGRYVAEECLKQLAENSIEVTEARVTVLGLTFKEDVPDTRNSKVFDVINHLKRSGTDVQVVDPLAHADALGDLDGGLVNDPADARPADAIIFAVPHDEFLSGGWPLMTSLLKNETGLILDLKGKLDRNSCPASVKLWRL